MTGRDGFKDRTRLAAALETLQDRVRPVERTESVPVRAADGRVLAAAVSPARPVPHYDRAAMDGFAVVAESTFGATAASPATFDLAAPSEDSASGVDDSASDDDPATDAPRVDGRTAVPVHTGSELPAGADAVVMVEDTTTRGERVEVHASVTRGENVSPAGEDVPGDAALFDAGRRLSPSDLALCRSVGAAAVEVYDRPTVDVIPTGEELVPADPDPGEVVETNALTVSRYVDRWGGVPRRRDVVTDDRSALRAAIERGLDADVVVTTGGSSVGERDLVADVVADRGHLDHHGLAIKPGHPVGLGVVEDTPVLLLPGYPVSCVVTAVQLLQPAVRRAARLPSTPPRTTTATLSRKLPSDAGVRTFARVRLEPTDEGEDAAGSDDVEATAGGDDASLTRCAVPLRTGGAGVLSSVTEADGWVVVPESVEGLDSGAVVTVEHWE
ncbi:molybdopterin molybdotransferase MoeA [Halorubellus sp. PRR65]|uniref:molybdopterin molybdotransferase MoeA n=1 Tax=Halorubellus sp. PRR65 TaxID=3098148 RepID=UPI002B256CF6|nr:molybdopterin molybdotransferase MoeA [Halorubellus sp. PRR65]